MSDLWNIVYSDNKILYYHNKTTNQISYTLPENSIPIAQTVYLDRPYEKNYKKKKKIDINVLNFGKLKTHFISSNIN